MDPILPLYRQLSSRFFLLALSFLLFLLSSFGLYFFNEQELTALKYQQLPAIENHIQRQVLLSKNDRLINDIITSKYSAQFGDYYQRLNDNLKNIAALSRNNRQLLEQLAQRLQAQAENVTRLTENYRRNIQLKDSAIIQLTLVTDSLSNLIATQAAQQKILSRKISQDTFAIQVMAVRVKALSKLVNSLNINRELHRGLTDSLLMFNQIDLQYDLIEFDYIQQKNQREINHWLESSTNVASKDANENGLIEQVTVLYTLLFSEQNTFAKWRGQLHRVNDFRAELVKQKAELTPLLDKKLVLPSLKSPNVPRQMSAWLAKADIVLATQHYIWLVGAIFALFTVIFISLLFSIRRKIKQFGMQSTAVVEELVTTGEVSAKIPGLEVTTMINHIEQLIRPAHSDIDFQHQQQQYQKYAALKSRHTGYVFWQFPTLSKQNKQQLCAVLGVELTNRHWRHCFSRLDVLAILSIARQAKQHKIVERITLISRKEKALVLTVEYIDGVWCGSLCDAENYRVLKDGNRQLQQQLLQQNQANKFAIIANSENASAMISAAMVQRQVLSLVSGNEQLFYQQLQQLLSWSAQQKTSAQLRRNDFVLTLSTVVLANELHTTLANISLYQAHGNNLLYLNMGANLASLVTLDSELFQAFISVICQKMLTEQRGAELDVELQVIDVNSAQQIIRMSFLLKNPSSTQKLMQAIDDLALADEGEHNTEQFIDHYVHDLALVFNVSNKESQQLGSAGKFSFELPLAIAENRSQTKKNKSSKLVKRTILVIATDKSSRERICRQLASSKARIETMQNLSLLRRQISIQHLTKSRLDVIILSSEVYGSDYDLITQHLASIPTDIQPKIMVVQPFNCAFLQRTGLFSNSNFPWMNDELIDSVEQLLNGTNSINLLVEPDVFLPYRFIPTQVEVLLAVSVVSKHQLLIRVLHWLGLQVTVVSQQESLERLWQSGRYLVVISEFLAFKSALYDPSAAIRGVFVLGHNKKSTKEIFSKLTIPKSWHSDCLAPVLNVQALTQQLFPWLKPDTETVVHNEQLVLQKQSKKSESSELRQVANKAEVTREKAVEMVVLDPKLDFKANLDEQNKALYEAFNLARFVQNQGSTELAAFMLDEYLTDINTNICALECALKAHDYLLATLRLSSLIKLARVIAATPLVTQCLALSKWLSAKNENEALSSAQKDELQQQLNHLKLCLVQLTEFAESI